MKNENTIREEFEYLEIMRERWDEEKRLELEDAMSLLDDGIGDDDDE